MTWEICLIKWKRQRAKKAKEKREKRLRKEDFKDALNQIHNKVKLLPERDLHYISFDFPETAEKLRKRGFIVEFDAESANCLWYKVGWKE